MIFTGSLTLIADPAAVWETLLDVDAVAGCIPGLQSATQIDERTFDGIIEATIGPMTGKFSFRAEIVESDPPRVLLAHIAGTDSVTKSTVSGDTTVHLVTRAAGETELRYRSSVNISGRLAILGEIVLRATSNMLLKETTERLKRRIEAGVAEGPGR